MRRYARVARFSGSSPDELRQAVPADAVRSLALTGGEGDDALLVSLFEDEEPHGDAEARLYRVETEWLSAERPARKARVSTHEGHPMRDVSPAPFAGLEGLAGVLWLIDRRSGEGVGILLFDSEESLTRGHAFVTNAPPGTAGPATSVALYSVGFLNA